MILLQQMIIMFLLMVCGYVMRKIHVLNDVGSKAVSGIVVYLANPAMVICAGMNKESSIQGLDLAKTLLFACVIFAALILCGKIIPVILRIAPNERGTYEIMTVFSNIGFMGFPLVYAMYGSDALLYASLFVLPYNVLIYTYAVGIMKKTAGIEDKGQKQGIPWKKILNIGVISGILMLVLYIGKIPVPTPIETTLTHLSNLTAPLSMIVIGDSLACADIKKLFTNKKLLEYVGIKLIIIPLIGVGLVKFMGMDPLLVGVTLVMMATPVGAMTAMMAQQYDANYDLASSGVALSSLLSVATMPIVALILGV